MHLEKAIPLFFWLCLFSWFWQSKILQSGSKAPMNQWMRACSKPIRTWNAHATTILAEGAIALPVTLSGGVLFASWKLLQFPSSLIVKVILAIFMGASAQYEYLIKWRWNNYPALASHRVWRSWRVVRLHTVQFGWSPEGSSKIEEVTLMRPIHGNL